MIKLDVHNFTSLLSYNKCILLFFYRDNCNDCSRQLSIIKNIEKQYKKCEFYSVNIVTDKYISNFYSVNVAPTILIFRNGGVQHIINDFISMEDLKKLL